MSIDLAPTLLELGGAAPDAKQHGRSLVPLLKGTATDWRTSILIEYFSDTVFPRILNMGYQAVRTEGHKYIHYTALEGMDELYDLKTDPYEMSSVIDSPAALPVLGQLKKELAKLQAETDYRPIAPARPSAPSSSGTGRSARK